MSTHTPTLLASVPKSSRIIEIGPSFNPIAPRSQGWNSATVDHMTREGLVEKYRQQPHIDVNRIEPVDFVWTGGLLSDAVPPEQHGSFDVLLASHMIEHTPDFVAFFDAAELLLKETGTVILVVPDKRFCFDYFQQVTTTGQVLAAHVGKHSLHPGPRAFDHFAYAITDGGAESWASRPSHGTRFIHSLEMAHQSYRLFDESPVYQDLHAWHFVPPSFELLLLELARLGETDWRIERITPTAGWEFFVWLRRGAREQAAAMTAEELDNRRVTLLKRILLENQAQIDLLLAGASDPTTEQARRATEGSFAVLETQAALARTEAENAELRNRVSAAEASGSAATQRLAAFEQSTFWRATALFRGAVDRVRHAKATRAGSTGR